MTGAVLRYVRTLITSDEPVDPGASLVTITDDGFNGTETGTVATTGTTAATSVTGSGSLTHSDDWQISGGLSLKISGTSQHYLTYTVDPNAVTVPDHGTHYVSIYVRYSQTPSSDVAFYELRTGGDAGVAAQIGITNDGRLFIRDTAAGTGTGYAESAVWTLGDTYLLECTYGASVQKVVVKQPDGTNATVETLSCDLTATTFSYERVGLMAAIAGGGVTTGNLDVEHFDTSTVGAVTNTNRGSSDQVTGASAALTITTLQSVSGAQSLRIQGTGATTTTYHMYRFDHAAHDDHYVEFYIRRNADGTDDVVVWQLYAADNLTIACQCGVDATGHLWVRDANNGTKQTATAVLTANTWFKVRVHADGGGGLTGSYYSSASSYTTLVQTFANATTLTATSFGKENLGLVASTAGTPNFYIDAFQSDSAQFPSSSSSSPLTLYVDRLQSSGTKMPAAHVVPSTGTFDAFCAPKTGALFGVTTSAVGVQGASTPSSISLWRGVVGRHPQMIGTYYTGGWNGIITGSSELSMWDPSTGTYAGSHAIPLLHWKPPGSWAQIAAGDADATIRTVANNLKLYGRKVFLTFYHEPETKMEGVDPSPLGTRAEYASAFRRVVTLFRQEGHKKAELGGQIVWFLQYVGFSTHAGTATGSNFDELDPGEDYIDVYGWDPYFWNVPGSGRDTFDELMRETSGQAGWDGMYNYLAKKHPSKWLGVFETGINIGDWDNDLATMQLNYNGFTDAEAKAVADDWRLSIADYPRLKFFVYWSSQTRNGYYQPYHPHAGPLFKAAMATLVQDSYFTHDMSKAP